MNFHRLSVFCMQYPMERGLKALAVLARAKPRLRRELNSSSMHSSPVELAYTSYESAVRESLNGQETPPIMILPGLLGSSKSWDLLSKTIHQRTRRKVIAVDARNHGNSPRVPESTYDHMVEDMILLIKKLEIGKAVMVGHSLGANVMMFLASNYPEYVEKLVSIDMSPISVSPSAERRLLTLFEAMRNVTLDDNLSFPEALQMANQQLSTTIKSKVTRQYILTNLMKAGVGKYEWRVDLSMIEKDTIRNITKLPAMNKPFDGPTLFIGGSRSDHISVNDHEQIKQLFPAAKIQYIQGAGHLIHLEKPEEFLDMLVSFINETQ